MFTVPGVFRVFLAAPVKKRGFWRRIFVPPRKTPLVKGVELIWPRVADANPIIYNRAAGR